LGVVLVWATSSRVYHLIVFYYCLASGVVVLAVTSAAGFATRFMAYCTFVCTW
jgi:hypothetical protein